MTRFLRFACTILSIGLIAAGYFLNNRERVAVGIIVFGILWIIGPIRWWKWIQPVSLFTIFIVAAVGLIMNIPLGFILPGALFGFLAWDLAEFAGRLQLAAPDDDTSRLERTHLRRMAMLMLASGGMCALALVIQIKFSFEWIVLLMFLTVWGIGQIVNWLLKKSN
ncbi:MAG TPA: hypothetical protein VII93_09990 [Anaerolineales bacterium]